MRIIEQRTEITQLCAWKTQKKNHFVKNHAHHRAEDRNHSSLCIYVRKTHKKPLNYSQYLLKKPYCTFFAHNIYIIYYLQGAPTQASLRASFLSQSQPLPSPRSPPAPAALRWTRE